MAPLPGSMLRSAPMKLRRLFLSLGLLAGLIYLGGCALLYQQQRALIYFPRPFVTAEGSGRLTLPGDGQTQVRVTVWPGRGSGALLFFGGNADDPHLSLPLLARTFPEYTLYLLHYRGYGESGGTPSEAALVGDALKLYDQIQGQHARVVVLARSLGTGVAVQLAAARPVQGLVLVTPYRSLVEEARSRYPYVPVDWLLQDRFESWRYAPRVQAPTLILGAAEDQVIAPANAEALARDFAPERVRYRLLPGVGHQSILDDPAYPQLLREALAEQAAGEGRPGAP